MVVRFRSGNEIITNKLRIEELKVYRLCKEERETLQHLSNHTELEEQPRSLEILLKNEGSGRDWMGKVLERRKFIIEKSVYFLYHIIL